MNRIVKIFFALALLAVCALGLLACTNGENADKSGLIITKYTGDEFYTVTGYYGSEDVTSLDIAAVAPEGKTIGRIKANAFSGDKTLISLVVPDTVEEIEKGAFAGMEKLASVTLPFVGNTPLSDAAIGQTGKAADKSVDAARLFGYIFGEDKYDYGVLVTQNYNSSSTGEYYLPLSLSEVTVNPKEDYAIPAYAFSGFTGLKKVTFGAKVTGVGDHAFDGCALLSSVNTVKEAETVVGLGEITYLGEGAFSGCVNLKDGGFSFGENAVIEVLGKDAFKGTGLSAVIVPDSVKKIEDGCFRESGVTSVILPADVTVGKNAFYKCSSLEKVYLKGSVKEIGDYAFAYCSKLSYFGKEDGEEANTIDMDGVVNACANSFADLNYGLAEELKVTYIVKNFLGAYVEVFYNTDIEMV